MNNEVRELVLKAGQNLSAEKFSDDESGCVFIVPCGAGRKQIVRIFQIGDYLKFVTPIGRYQHINPVAALQYNMGMEECAIGLMDFDLADGLGKVPTLFLISTQNIKTTDLLEIQNKMEKIATEGDNLEKHLFDEDRT